MNNASHPVEPASGRETINSVVGGNFIVRVGMVPIGLMLLNPIWIMDASTLVFSIIPIDMPNIPSWVSLLTQLSVWLLSQQ
jgi:hypothetical protein